MDLCTPHLIFAVMKVFLYNLLYWTVGIVLVAVLLSSLSYTFAEALFIGTLFLPGALGLKYFLPKLSFADKRKGVFATVCLILAVLIGEFLLIVVGNIVLSRIHQEVGYIHEVPDILVNPVFIALLVVVLEGGDMLLSRWLARRFPASEQTITFVSDRQHVSLLQGEIRYIESNDTEVRIYATEGRCFRNKTPISQWENLLGSDFIRIHRSYLVSRAQIVSISTDSVQLADTSLPISRKYREKLKGKSEQKENRE